MNARTWHLGPVAACLLLFAVSAWAAEPTPRATHPLHSQETSQVTQVVLRGLLPAGPRDVTVTLYHRGDYIINGYALAAGLPQLPWTVVAQPPGRHGVYEAATGAEIEYPASLMKRYGYHSDDFRDIRARWSKGELIARRDADPPALRWSAAGDSLSGTIDLVMSEDGVGRAGAWIDGAYRVEVKADTAKNGEVRGTWTARRYDWKDRTYGAAAPRREGQVEARRMTEPWKPQPGTEFAPGKDWPHTHGPNLNMAAADCGKPLVRDLNDARLVWVAEEPGGGGKGAINKTPFGVGPLVANDLDAPGYSAPVFADGRVYLFTVFPDFDRLQGSKEWQDSILRVRGAPLGGESFGMYVDRFLCIDARTGRTLWKHDTPFTAEVIKDEKSGRGVSPCVVNGVLVGRGGRGLYGLDAATGKLLWEKKESGMGSTGGPGSCDESVVGIGGVAILRTGAEAGTTLVALDPRTGQEKWRVPRAGGFNAVPSSIVLDGETFILTASCVQQADKRVKEEARRSYERLLLIEPRTGRIVWEDSSIGTSGAGLLVSGDLVCGQVTPTSRSSAVGGNERPGVWRITRKGATPVWQMTEKDRVHFPHGRFTPLLTDGAVFLDSRETGFTATELLTGKPRASIPHLWNLTQGDHNWTWCVASDGRIITSGMLQFDARDLRQSGGLFPVPLAGGYTCPIKPALVDGRLFVRTSYALVCYDLRADPAAEARAQEWEVDLKGVWVGLPDTSVPVRFRSRDGQLLSQIMAYPPDAAAAGLPMGRDRRTARWEMTSPTQPVATDGKALSGVLPIHSGTDEMPVTLALQRSDIGVSGTWRRSVPAAAKVDRKQGTFTIAGPYEHRQYPTPWDKANPFARFGALPAGIVSRILTLDNFLTKEGESPKPLMICLDHGHGQVTRAIGSAFGFSKAWHEVDVQSFVCDTTGLKSKLTVILHSDAFTPAGPDGGQVAILVTLEAAPDSPTGTWTAEYGVPWSATGKAASPTKTPPVSSPSTPRP